ncbi:ricin B lectin domain-containing protein [Panaeolus papilionaceus]|nr:ricin B lectin domain-containing protein [Panaeolus papilionaceus]
MEPWVAERIEGEHGGWHLRNAQSGKYLSLPSQKPQNDTQLLANDTKFLWHIWDEETVQNAVRICVPNTKKDVDLSDHGNAAPGTPISVWGRWEGENQLWRFQEA